MVKETIMPWNIGQFINTGVNFFTGSGKGGTYNAKNKGKMAGGSEYNFAAIDSKNVR